MHAYVCVYSYTQKDEERERRKSLGNKLDGIPTSMTIIALELTSFPFQIAWCVHYPHMRLLSSIHILIILWKYSFRKLCIVFTGLNPEAKLKWRMERRSSVEAMLTEVRNADGQKPWSCRPSHQPFWEGADCSCFLYTLPLCPFPPLHSTLLLFTLLSCNHQNLNAWQVNRICVRISL